MTTYCKSCGEGIEYLLKTPVTCPFCSKSLSSVAVNSYVPSVTKPSPPVKPKRKVAVQTPVVDDDDDDVEDDDLIDDDDGDNFIPPSINANSVDIIIDSPKPQRLLDLAVAGATSPQSTINRPIEDANLSRQQILDQFMQEAGTKKK